MRILGATLVCLAFSLPLSLACGGGRDAAWSQVRNQAAADHGCPVGDTHVSDEIEGVWQADACGHSYLYERGEDRFVQTADLGVKPEDTGYEGAGYAPAPSSGGPVRVHGYRRRDGTYVHSHTRRRPR